MAACVCRRVVTLAGVAALAWPRPAAAQYVGDYLPLNVPGYNEEMGVTVLSRLRPLYEQPGIEVGSFIVRPNLDESFGYNSNPEGISRTPGSWALQTAPSLSINSDWSRNSLGASFSASNYQYFNTPSQDRTDWTASIGGGYTIGRSQLMLAYSHLSLNETAADIAAVPSTTPIHYQVDNLHSAYTFDLGRLSFTPNLDLFNYDYDTATISGTPLSQQYRNRDVISGGVTTKYELSEFRNLLLVLQGADEHYTTPQAGQPSYNSKNALALFGMDYTASGVWRYQVLAGGEIREFESPLFKTHTAPIVEARAIWTPTGRTTVTALLSRRIEGPQAEETAGYTYTTANIVVDHEYLRNVLLQGRVGVQVASFLLGGQSQIQWTAGAGITWLMNHKMRLTLSYNFLTQSGISPITASGVPNPTVINTGGYTQHVVLLTMHFGL